MNWEQGARCLSLLSIPKVDLHGERILLLILGFQILFLNKHRLEMKAEWVGIIILGIKARREVSASQK
jgi:hypothetical protein